MAEGKTPNSLGRRRNVFTYNKSHETGSIAIGLGGKKEMASALNKRGKKEEHRSQCPQIKGNCAHSADS